jgi:hypothetical protein
VLDALLVVLVETLSCKLVAALLRGQAFLVMVRMPTVLVETPCCLLVLELAVLAVTWS